MKRIFRYDLFDIFNMSMNPKVRTTLPLPQGARVIHVALQDRAPHHPCMWVTLDETLPHRDVEFCIVGTGHEYPDGWTHVGTWQQDGYVWHLFQGPLTVEVDDDSDV